MLPPSPTTLKKDKNKMSKQTFGYVDVVDGELGDVTFIPTDNGNYQLHFKQKEKNKKLSLIRKNRIA